MDQRQFEELAKLRCEDQELKEILREKKESVEALKKEKEVVAKEIQEALELSLSRDVHRQVQEANRLVKELKEQEELVAQRRAEEDQLRERIAELRQKKEQTGKEVENLSIYRDFLERVGKENGFKDVQEFADYLENLLFMEKKLSLEESDSLAQMDAKRKELLDLENKHQVAMLHKEFHMSQMQTELENCTTQTNLLQQKWNNIQECSTKQTRMLGEIHLAIWNLFEMTGGTIGEDGVDVNDTDTQLEWIQSFIENNDNIVKQYEISCQNETETDSPKTKSERRNFASKKH